MMTRTKLADRTLPNYTRGEEIFNMVSHIVGGGLGVVVLILCVTLSILRQNVWSVVGCTIYGISMITLYTCSSVYHGLTHIPAKKVMRVIDHCTIYFLICGTYTPILLTAIREISPIWAWVIFGLVWGLAAMAITLTAIDLNKYSKLSMACYIGMGWCIVLAWDVTVQAIATPGLWLLVGGGVAYTVGAVIYGIGKKHRYMHSVFHLFVVLGSLLQFFCILFYVI